MGRERMTGSTAGRRMTGYSGAADPPRGTRGMDAAGGRGKIPTPRHEPRGRAPKALAPDPSLAGPLAATRSGKPCAPARGRGRRQAAREGGSPTTARRPGRAKDGPRGPGALETV